MIKLIIGKKGSGKTKKLMEMVNNAVETSDGNVVCIEKGDVSTFSVSHRARLVNVNDFHITNYNELYGLICGMVASNYDVREIFVDATFRIGGRDKCALYNFLFKTYNYIKKYKIDIIFTLSCDKSELSEGLFEFCKEI